MGRFVRVAACAGLAVLTAGCFWAAPGQDADRQAFNSLETRVTVATVGSLTEAWSVQLDEGAAGDPVTSAHGAHVSDARSVYAVNPATGAELWQHSVTAPRVMGQPFVRGDEVLVGNAVTGVAIPGGDGARTTILDTATGAVSGELPSAIRALRGSKALSVAGGWTRFGALQPIWIWTVHVNVKDLDTSETLFGPAMLFSGNGREAVDQDVTLGAGSFYLPFPFSDGVSPCPTGLLAYDIEPVVPQCGVFGAPSWTISDRGPAPALSDDQAIAYFATDPSTGPYTAKAVDAATGAVLWSGPLPAYPGVIPSLAGGKLYVPTDTGQVVVFDAAGCGAPTCTPVWTTSTGTGSAIVEQVAVAGGVAYTASADGMIHAFDAAGCAAPPCAPIWSAATGSRITGAPTVSNGQLYVGTQDGRLIAYGLPR